MRGATTSYIETSYCINAFVWLLVNFSIDFLNYDTFFQYISSEYCKEETTYIDWACAENKTKYCDHIQLKLPSSKTYLCVKLDASYTFSFKVYFEKKEHTTKEGKVVDRLQPVVNKTAIEFISNILTKIIHRCNHLKHCMKNIPIFREIVNHILINIDFYKHFSMCQ